MSESHAAAGPSSAAPAEPSVPAHPAVRTQSAGLLGLSLVVLLASLGLSIANVTLPTWVGAFDASLPAVQWVVLAYLLSVTTLAVSVGRLGDLFGRRRLLLIGTGVFIVASALCAAAPTLSSLIAARAFQGVGAALMMTLAMAVVGDAVPKQRVGRAMGLLGSVSAFGTALGPAAGGALIAAFGWPAIFLVKVPLAMLGGLLIARHLPSDRGAAGQASFDWRGAFLLALSLSAYALSMTWHGSPGTRSALLILATLTVAAFLWLQARLPFPLLRPALFSHRPIAVGFAMSALVTTVAMTTLVVGPFYLSGALGLSPGAVGATMSIGPLAAALVGVPAGRAVDRFGARRLILSGLLAMLVGCIALASAPMNLGVAGYGLSLAMTTAGFAMFQAANNTWVLTASEPALRGVVSGLLGLSRNLGLITGASAMAAIFAHLVGGSGPDTIEAGSMAAGAHGTFAVAGMLSALALLIATAWARPTASVLEH